MNAVGSARTRTLIDRLQFAAATLLGLGLLAFSAFMTYQWGAAPAPSAENDYQNLATVGLFVLVPSLIGAWIGIAMAAGIGSALNFWKSGAAMSALVVPVAVAAPTLTLTFALGRLFG